MSTLCEWEISEEQPGAHRHWCIHCGRAIVRPRPNPKLVRNCVANGKPQERLVIRRPMLFPHTWKHLAGVWRCEVCSITAEADSVDDLKPGPCDTSKSPACECPGPGICHRHNMKKTENLWEICQRDANQRATWDYVASTGNSPFGEKPSGSRMVVNFAVASLKHLAGGAVHVSDDVIERRLEICQACPSGRYNGAYCEHIDCGCAIKRSKFASKLAWASESCPDGHWGAEV